MMLRIIVLDPDGVSTYMIAIRKDELAALYRPVARILRLH